MTTLEKLQSDMEDDAYFGLSIEERYDLLKRDAETIAKRLDAVVAIANKLPDKLYVYREFAGVTYKDRSAKDELIAIAEGRE